MHVNSEEWRAGQKEQRKFMRVLTELREPGAYMTRDAKGYFLQPSRQPVRPEIAARVIKYPFTIPGGDGLFPGLDQTWKLKQ